MPGIILICTSLVTTLTLFAAAKYAAGADLITYASAAQLTGITGLILLSWSYILAIRHALLEELFGGLDTAYKIHRSVGVLAFVLVINHPLTLILAAQPTNTIATYLLPSASIPYSLGVAAMYLLIVLLVITLFVDLPYKLWKKTHEMMGLVILLSGVHAYLVPSQLNTNQPLRLWILVWTAVAIASYLYKRLLYYGLAGSTIYSITKIERDQDTAVIHLSHTKSDHFIKVKPGQYVFVSNKNLPRDEHPFTVLSQDGPQLVIGVKTVGPFTLRLPASHTGQELIIRGPYGNFASSTHSAREMVWIAGGIGITPFASMARVISPAQKVTLFYSTRDGGPAIFRALFRGVCQMTPNFRFVEHMSSIAGRLNAKSILAATQLASDTFFYLCGPSEMMREVTHQLILHGVKRRRIIYEDFNLK